MINATVRLRGVMSLDTLPSPVLLVPSRSYVEIVEPPPFLSREPVAITRLSESLTREWPHQERVAGMVTYRSESLFYLQDQSGAVKVVPLGKTPGQIGESVDVIGFPGSEHGAIVLMDAVSSSLASKISVLPKALDFEDLSMEANGLLVTVKGKLISQRWRENECLLELQVGDHLFEASLESDARKLGDFAPGAFSR